MNYIKFLEQLGLTEKEAKVYFANLEIGESTVTQLSLKSGIKRTTVHEILKTLMEKQLVSLYAEGKRKKYLATDPINLKLLLEQKNKVLEYILPSLLAISQNSTIRPSIQVFQGKEGLIKLYDDTLKSKHEIYSFVEVESVDKELLIYLENDYLKKRRKLQIPLKAIATDSKLGRLFKADDGLYLRQTKLVSAKQYPFDIEINIYGNKTAFISFKKNELFGVIIDSHAISKTMKTLFHFFWNNIK